MRSWKILLFIGLSIFASQATPVFAQQTAETESAMPTEVTGATPEIPAATSGDIDETAAAAETAPAADEEPAADCENGPLYYQPSQNATEFSLGVDYRLRGIYVTKMPLDETELLDARTYLEHRLRLTPEVSREHYSFKGIFDVHQGPIAGDTDEPPSQQYDKRDRYTDYALSLNRSRYWADLDAYFGLIRFGRQPLDWGLGMLGNDGLGDDDKFGDNYYGDIVDAFSFATKPVTLLSGGTITDSRLVLAVSTVWQVLRDGTADENDDVSEVIVLLQREAHEHGGMGPFFDFDGGIYFARRYQRFDTDIKALDIYVNLLFGTPENGGKIRAELATIGGATRLAAGAYNPGRADIAQLGFIGGATLNVAPASFDLEYGYASGDGNPYDEAISNFSFHPDYNVGLILFDEYLPALSANVAYKLTDSTIAAHPPQGFDSLPSAGSITNARYLFPSITIDPVEDVQARLGLLMAWTNEPLIDVYRSAFFTGGDEINYRGGSGGNFLGSELDFALRYKSASKCCFLPDVGIKFETGVFLPGDAFANADNELPTEEYTVRLGVDLQY